MSAATSEAVGAATVSEASVLSVLLSAEESEPEAPQPEVMSIEAQSRIEISLFFINVFLSDNGNFANAVVNFLRSWCDRIYYITFHRRFQLSYQPIL
jgi:hypothetical protein